MICVVAYYMAAQMAARCDLPYVSEPACVNAHLDALHADEAEAWKIEDEMTVWRKDYAAQRGFSETGSDTAQLCRAAEREIREKTDVGKALLSRE